MGYRNRKHEYDSIPPYRMMLIEKAVQEFREAFSISGVPVNCIAIARILNKNFRILKNKRIYVTDSNELSSRIYAKMLILPHDNGELVYFIVLNSSQLVDPESNHARWKMEHSRDRMVNFTLAHEFGHIMLEHAETLNRNKSADVILEEELEANEFAGQLLMPKEILEHNGFQSLAQAAKELLVSESALKRRLSQLHQENRLGEM